MDTVKVTYKYGDQVGTIHFEGEVSQITLNANVIHGQPSPPQFKVGDFVRVVYPSDYLPSPTVPQHGMVGKVISNTPATELGVEFPEHTRGHSCRGRAALGHGWHYFYPGHCRGEELPTYESVNSLVRIDGHD